MKRRLSLAAVFAALAALVLSLGAGVKNDSGSIVDRFFAAYRSGSVDDLLAVYAPDAVFEDVNQRHRVVGHDELRAMLQDLVAMHQQMGIREKRRVAEDRTVVVEYEYVGTLSGAALSQATGKSGCPDLSYTLPVTSWYDIAGGRIRVQKDFIDLASLRELQKRAAASAAPDASHLQ